MKNKQSGNLWIVLVLVLALVAYALWSMSQNSTPVSYENTSPTDQSMNSTEDITTGSINIGVPAASISYQNALIKYKNARLQLDKVCQASPDHMTFKNNAYLMVDNRAPVARTIKIGSVFPIKAYGFKIIQLSSATLPATWLVDCDKSQNVSTILIER